MLHSSCEFCLAALDQEYAFVKSQSKLYSACKNFVNHIYVELCTYVH